MKRQLSQILLALLFATPLISMEVPRGFSGEYNVGNLLPLMQKVKAATEANEEKYACTRPFITLTVMQTAPRFYSLEGYVKQLTNNREEKMQVPGLGWYKRLNPETWHMTLITIALPLSDRLVALSKDPSKKGMFVAERRKFAEQALKSLGAVVAAYADGLKGLEFTYKSIGGIGTNKFVAGFFGFKHPVHDILYHTIYGKILSEYMNQYPQIWMRYGIEFLPHVSVMKKSYAPQEQKPQGAVCKGSGRGIQKAHIDIAPAVPVIENLILFHNNRNIHVSARGDGYPVSETLKTKVPQKFLKRGELFVTEKGEIISEEFTTQQAEEKAAE